MPARHPDRPPSLVFATSAGEILDYPGLQMAGSSSGRFVLPTPEDLIELPAGSELFVLPGRLPVGIDPHTGNPAILASSPYDGSTPQAVASFMAPAHTTIFSAAYQTSDNAPLLPLFAYSAVGWHRGKFWAAGFRSDPDPRQDAAGFQQERINRRTRAMLGQHQANRLIQHLGKCCLTYGCPAARNYFLGRWEAPLPTSPACNADCVGCISLQPSGCCPASQERIKFVPTPAEIMEIAVPHLKQAKRAIVSFGQGCEGEPLLQAVTIAQAIRQVRSHTDRGTVNLNSNASMPEAVERLICAGLDSIRVSLNSARPEMHERYYRPKGFSLTDVRESIRLMKTAGRHVSLNYFILPGFTDDPEEFAALCDLIADCRPDLIQLRNLNMDPEWYRRVVNQQPQGEALGIRNWLRQLKTLFPLLRFGYFNPALR
ncbi:MAG TPA: radical SAM protein [Desulfobulbaceae bacterium]|nr:radical SAM protein [Desulfobulbaceae bacterium]